MDLSSAPNQLHLHFPQQEMGSHSDSQSPDNMIAPDQNQNQNQNQDQKKPRPPEGEPQSCPRCDSTNTKFCYYNNYSLTQPRYFCKACRRYWTKGGTLRNVPVGGGCRKSSKRSSVVSSPSHFLKRPHSRDHMVPAMMAGPTPLFPNLGSHAYGCVGLGFDGVEQDLPMSSRALLEHHSFLQEFQYGNGGGGMMFHNMCGYEEAGGGNSNCVSGISEDMVVAASMAPYEEVKQERGEIGGLWGLPWQMNNGENGSLMGGGGGGGDLESIRENNWNGFIGNSTWGLLNTPALM